MFDPEDFNKLGARLLLGACGPAESRTVISRAYYAVFLVAGKILESHFHLAKHGEVHQQVQMLFVNCAAPAAKDIARKLDDLRDKRNDADYRLHSPNVDSPNTAKLYHALSEQTIKKTNELLSQTPSPVLDEMKNWAKASGKVRLK